jgi:ATP-dependent RNA helicase DDX3X
LFGTQGTAGINFSSYTEIKVTRSGPDDADAVPSLTSFRALSSVLPDYLFSNLTLPTRMNYATPTPIQQHTVALGLEGKDIMACAQTGSGKTCAFLVPLLASIWRMGVQAKEVRWSDARSDVRREARREARRELAKFRSNY